MENDAFQSVNVPAILSYLSHTYFDLIRYVLLAQSTADLGGPTVSNLEGRCFISSKQQMRTIA